VKSSRWLTCDLPFASFIEGRYTVEAVEAETPTPIGDEKFLLSPPPLSAGSKGTKLFRLVEQKANMLSRSSNAARTDPKV
jgi:hypothetical protein